MALTKIAVGTSANDGTGDPLRTAFQRVNTAFDQIDANTLAIAGALMKSALGTGVETALGIAIGSVGAAILNGGALGTPSGGTLTNCTGLPAAGVVGTAAILGANTFTGAQTLSVNGAASTPAATLTGAIFTGGSATTTKPQFLIEPTGTTSTGWDTNGTALGINTPSSFTGKVLSVQKNGGEIFCIDPNSGGFARVSSSLQFGSGAINSCGISVHGSDNLLFNSDGEYTAKLYSTQLILQSTCQFNISSGNAYSGTADIGFARTSAGVGRISNGSTGRGTLDAAGYQVGGVAGASFGPGAPTSITVVNGIITAIS